MASVVSDVTQNGKFHNLKNSQHVFIEYNLLLFFQWKKPAASDIAATSVNLGINLTATDVKRASVYQTPATELSARTERSALRENAV